MSPLTDVGTGGVSVWNAKDSAAFVTLVDPTTGDPYAVGGGGDPATGTNQEAGNDLLAEVVSATQDNYAYEYAYNAAGDLATKTRTEDGVSQVRTYTYNPDGSLATKSAWV